VQKSPQLDAFVQRLSADRLTEVEAAVALVWFATHSSDSAEEITVREVADMMVSTRMSGSVNTSRLTGNLSKHSHVVRGREPGTFRIRSSQDARLSQRFAEYVDLSRAPVSDAFLSADAQLGGRRHLEQVRREANGSYERGFYNASAVMCRRLAEMLLIEALETSGATRRIRDSSGHLLGFSDLISIAQSGEFIKLSRTAPAALQKVKELGDAGAHHRHFIAAKKDLDALNPGYSMLISELSVAACL
jgi:hypothetical protein